MQVKMPAPTHNRKKVSKLFRKLRWGPLYAPHPLATITTSINLQPMLPRSWWYRRRPAWMDNYSEGQLLSGGCLTIILLPFLVVGATIILLGLLSHFFLEPSFWFIVIAFCLWNLFKDK